MKKSSQDPQMNPFPTGEMAQGRRPSGASPADNTLDSPDAIGGSGQEKDPAKENNPSPAGEVERGRRPSGASPAGDAATASPKRQVGRPLKYRQLLDILDDATIYSPGSIVRNGEEKGLLPPLGPADQSQRRLRIRHTLCRYAVNHKFPRPGEGWVKLDGQAPVPGWYGDTWKAALPQ